MHHKLPLTLIMSLSVLGLAGGGVLGCDPREGTYEECETDTDCEGNQSCLEEGKCECAIGQRGATCGAGTDCFSQGEVCLVPSCTCGPEPACGNGVLDEGEECERDEHCGGRPCLHPTVIGPESCTCSNDICEGTWTLISNIASSELFTVVPLEIGNTQTASDGVSQAAAEGNTDQRCLAYGVIDAGELDPVFTSCTTVGMQCPFGVTDLAGPTAVVVVDMADVVPYSDDVWSYQYGVAFRTDTDTSNDWTGIPAYPNDTYIGTDTWFQFLRDAGFGWKVELDDISPAQESVEREGANVRVFMDGSRLVFYTPLAELGTSVSFRVTAFRHDGTWLNGQWNIDYYPLVTAPLIPLDE